jgi:hypothetical protein
MDLDRRTLYRSVQVIHFQPMPMMLTALAFAGALAATHAGTTPSYHHADTLRVVLVVGDTIAQRSLLRGALLGAEEARHTGALFGTVVTLRVAPPAFLDSVERATSPAASRSPLPSLYLVAGDVGTCSRLMLQSERDSIPVLDAGCAPGESTRGVTVYSLFPSTRAMAATDDSTRLELWHSSLERFGGEQLNVRFRRRFGAPMDSGAWAGWFALKVALDAALHSHATSGAALLRQLADPRAQYDGQKGRPLHFAPDTHRLIQPLYRVAGRGDAEHVVAEVMP